MSNKAPSTPVKVPSSAANYTAATLDPDLRSQINSVLLHDGHVPKYACFAHPLRIDLAGRRLTHLKTKRIQEALLHALNSDSANWPTTIQSHALSLLRSGEVTTFPDLLRRVLEDVRHDSALNPVSSSTNGKPATTTNGDAAAKANGSSGEAKTTPSLAIPESVVDEALRVTREHLDSICDIEDDEAA
ncbi:hypothetical protein CEP54_001477 [Fusarium duplospermum]|uniref:Uncharacterized protein n=1 Tax=Fusarium duplospermum TaxID=1325734 RepID=A0A428R0Z0_9HYPO|nr:hypothetical protein CEP54_001477 [Fusarium duplospermum]